MDRSVVVDRLRANLLDGGHVVRVERGDWARFTGVPVRLSSSLVLLRSLDDYFVDGFVALRIGDITDVVRGPSQEYTEKVLRAEGLLVPPTDRELARVDNMRALLEDVGRNFPSVVLKDEEDEEFLLGPLVGVTDESAELRYINPAGQFDATASTMPLDRITRVMYGDRYSTWCTKHAT